MADYKSRSSYTRGTWKKGSSGGDKDRGSRVRQSEVTIDEARDWFSKSKLGTQEARWFHMLYYGDTGNGKSFLAATAPRALIMAIDQHGNWALRESERHRLQAAFPKTRIEFDPVIVRSFSDVWRIYKVLEHGCQTGEWPDGRMYWSWVMDGFGELQAICMDEVTSETRHDAPEMQDYKLVAADFRRLILRFMRLPMHGVITCNERNLGDSEKPHWAPALTGQLTEQLPTHMDVVGRLIVSGEGHRVVLTRPGANHVAKDLTGRLEPVESQNLQVQFARLLGPDWYKQMVAARSAQVEEAKQEVAKAAAPAPVEPDEVPMYGDEDAPPEVKATAKEQPDPEESEAERAGRILAQRFAGTVVKGGQAGDMSPGAAPGTVKPGPSAQPAPADMSIKRGPEPYREALEKAKADAPETDQIPF